MTPPAQAQAGAGAISERSRATIAIRVSVSPRFTLAPAAEAASADAASDRNAESVTLGSNAPALRTRLVRDVEESSQAPAAAVRGPAGQTPGNGQADHATLMLVTPD